MIKSRNLMAIIAIVIVYVFGLILQVNCDGSIKTIGSKEIEKHSKPQIASDKTDNHPSSHKLQIGKSSRYNDYIARKYIFSNPTRY